MTMMKLSSLAVGVAAFAMACADATGPTRTILPDAPTLALNPVPGYPFPSSPNDGLVTVCKISNAAGTFTFDVTVNGVSAPGLNDVSITVSAGQAAAGTRVCAATPLINSGLESLQIENVVIAENDPGAGWATVVDIDQYFDAALTYHASAFADLWNTVPRQATVFINDDLEKRVTFRNTFTSPPLAICDFITFGRLVVETGPGKDDKVVISGNTGGNNADGSIKNEFHIEANGVDNHVADAISYGPITSGPLFGLLNSRIVTGTAKNGVLVELRLWDGGEPGKGTDMVYVKLGNTVLLGPQFIDQGNMQYHSNCRGPG